MCCSWFWEKDRLSITSILFTMECEVVTATVAKVNGMRPLQVSTKAPRSCGIIAFNWKVAFDKISSLAFHSVWGC